MGEAQGIELIRRLWDYHWWANRRLYNTAAALGEEAIVRVVGKQFSFPSILRMLGHIYGGDWVWQERWRGTSPTQLPGGEMESLAALRERWDALEPEQRAFIESLAPADLSRVIEYRQFDGRQFRSPLWQILQHVPNHATHHRSELATMLTMVSGSPPPTDLILYHRISSGQQSA